MAGYAGIDSQLGVAVETTYGTYVVPNEFAEFDSESLTRQSERLTSSGLRAGRLIPPLSRDKETTRGGAGDTVLKVPNKGFGIFLDMLHGNTITPVQQGATAAYKQTHNIGLTRPFAKSRTIQVGKPSTNGTVQPFSFLGSKLVQAVFACDLGAELMFTGTWDSQDVTTANALATASYPTGISSFDFTEGTVTLQGSQVGLVSSFNLTIPLPMKTNRYGLASSALKAVPIINDYMRPSASLTIEWTDLVARNYWINGTAVTVVADFIGPIIASTYHEEMKFTLNATHLVGDDPQVGGPDVLDVNVPVSVFDDGSTTPIVIEYTSIDVAI